MRPDVFCLTCTDAFLRDLRYVETGSITLDLLIMWRAWVAVLTAARQSY